jgi:hypothetical protein
MPERGDIRHVFLGECFWAPAFRETIAETNSDDWSRGSFDRIPMAILPTTVDYVCESSGFDCSIDESLSIRLPVAAIANGMKLRWNGVEGQYIDQNDRVTAFDPSVFEAGPGALLMRPDALKKYLAENELELFWTLLGEKQLIGGHTAHLDNSGWLQVSGVYRLTSSGIVGHCKPEYRQKLRGQRKKRR